MAQTSSIFARRSDLPSCTERLGLDLNKHALDLNRDALDLNSLPLFSPEAPFLFETHPFAHPPLDPALAYVAATSFLIPEPAATNPWTSQATSNNTWASEFAESCEQGILDGLGFHEKPPEEWQGVGSGGESGDSVSGGEGSSGAQKCNEDGTDKSQQSFIEVIQSPSWLPAGWITEVKTRKAGSTAGTKDKYYKDPISGSRFRSRNEVFYYLQTGRKTRCKLKPRLLDTGAPPDLHATFPSSCHTELFRDGGIQPPAPDGAKVQLNVNGPMASRFDLGTSYLMTPSIHSLPNQSPEVPAWLRRILPVGAFPDFVDCDRPIYPHIGQTEGNVLQNLSQLGRSRNLDINVRPHMGGAANLLGENRDLMLQINNEAAEAQTGRGIYLDRLDPLLRHSAVRKGQKHGVHLSSDEQTGLPMENSLFDFDGRKRKVEKCQINGPSFEQLLRQDFLLRQQDRSNAEQMHMERVYFNSEISGKDEKRNQKDSFSCDDLTGQHTDHGMPSLNNVVPAAHTQPLKDVRNNSESIQATNLSTKSPMLHQGRRSWTKQIGVRKVQKLKHREGKELLALLGRKLCWQGLGLLAEEVRHHPKEAGIGQRGSA